MNHDVIGALREHRNYRLFAAGQLVSLVGTWAQSIAQTWLVYRLTNDATWLGLTTLAQQLPSFFLATAGGLVADRYPRRTVLVITQSAAMLLALVLAALTLSGHVRVIHVLGLATLGGVVSAIDSPTRQSFVMEMVGRAHLTSAIAFNSSLATAASAIGPAIAGLATRSLGEGGCFLANGVSYLAVIGGLLAMRDLQPSPARSREPLRARILEGFRFVAGSRELRPLLGLLALTAFFGIPYATVIPVFAKRVLHGDAAMLGWLMGATGGGALVAGLILASGRAVGPRVVGAAGGALGVLLFAFSLVHSLAPALVVVALLGAATMTHVSATNTLVQTSTPDALRGRVMAVWLMLFMGFSPLGAVGAGYLASHVDPRWPLVLGGAGCVLGAIAFLRVTRETRSG